MEKELKIRNNKNEGYWFKVPNKLIDEYSEYVGYISVAIYVFLCRYINSEMQKSIGTRIAFPSEKLIAKKLWMSPRTVIRHLKILVKYRMISIEKVKRVGKKWKFNIYILNDSSPWLKLDDLKSHIQPDSNDVIQVIVSHMKEKVIKNKDLNVEISEKRMAMAKDKKI